MESFQPRPFQVIDDPRQLKAFTDPLRSRILSILIAQAATNQQLADALGEPHAKVLYHVRVLLDADLIQLVETRVKGGNVEKYYRAVARMFALRSGLMVPSDVVSSVAISELEAVQQEAAASIEAWPDQRWGLELRQARIAPERATEFHERLIALIAEYWGGPEQGPEEDPAATLLGFAAVLYRHPAGSSTDSDMS